jgi:AcrR family transcriptional regulator
VSEEQTVEPSPSTEDRIIHASFVLISEHGLGGVTMSQIADTAGVARQTLYNHYQDIDSIVAATIKRHNSESIDLLEISLQIADSPIDRLEQMVRHFASIGVHAHQSVDLRSALAVELQAGLDKYKDVVESHISEIIVEGQRTGDFRPNLSVEIDTVLIRSLLDGVQDLAAGSPERAAQIATAGNQTILAALS